MMNNFALKYVFVFFIMSLQTCLNVENNIEEDDNILLVMDDISNSSNCKSNEEIRLRIIDYLTKNENNTSDNRDVVDDDHKENSNGCIPGLMKGDIYSNSKGFNKVNDQSNSSKYNLAIKIKRSIKNNSMNYQHKESIPKGLKENRRSNVFGLNNKIYIFKPGKPVLREKKERIAKLGNVPYKVSFKWKSKWKGKTEWVPFCAGVIIGPTQVLSAAHCFENKKLIRYWPCLWPKARRAPKKLLKKIIVVSGSLEYVYRNQGQMRHLKSMYYPFDYKHPYEDISIGYVTVPFTFDANVNKVPYEQSFSDHDKKVCVFSGYGRTITDYIKFYNEFGEFLYERPVYSDDIFLLADLTTFPNKKCSEVHNRKMTEFICTDELPSAIKKGIYGGPLVCSGTLVGIAIGSKYRSGLFFTRISNYTKFIERGKATRLTHNHLVHFIHVCFVILSYLH